ncbi:MAG: cupin [Thiohalospira sp.]
MMHASRDDAIETLTLLPEGPFPNNPHYPVVLHRQVFPEADPAAIEATFAAHGWPPAWRWGVFDWHHFHAGAHEVLGCYRGSATLQLGGPDGPLVEVAAGDAVLLPAGTAHRSVAIRDGFTCVGAYPVGQEPDIQRGDPADREALEYRIHHVPFPAQDPVYGSPGSLTTGRRQ